MFQTPKTAHLLFLALLTVGFGPPAAAEHADGPLIEEAGYEALEAGRLEQAERLFERALKHDPQSAASIAGLGFLRMRAWEFRDAESRFREALEQAPHDAVIEDALADARFWAALKEGDAAFAQGLNEKAAARYQEALEVKPGDAAATERLAKLPQAPEPVKEVAEATQEELVEAAIEKPATQEDTAVAEDLAEETVPEPTAAEAVVGAEQSLKAGDLAAAQKVLVEQAKSQSEWATIRNIVRRGLTQPLSRVELQALLAAAYLGVDDVPNGIRVTRAAEADLLRRGRYAPTYLEVQAARLMLARNPFDHELHSRLTQGSRRAGLPAPAVDDFHELWIRWSVDWARKSLDRGNPKRAITVLERARLSYPREQRIAAALTKAREGLEEPKRRRPRWNSNPGVIVIHGLREDPVIVAGRNRRPDTPRRLSGGITIAGA